MEVPEEHMGSVVELLGRRRGQMFDMEGVGFVKQFLSSVCYLHDQTLRFVFVSVYIAKLLQHSKRMSDA